MNARSLVVLLVLLGVLGGGALLVYQQQRGREAANVATLGQPVLKTLKAADVAMLRVEGPDGTLSLVQKDERWTITERNDFPADFEKLRGFVLKAIELKVGQSEPIGEKDRARLHLMDSGEGAGTRLIFAKSDGTPVARLIVGKKYFKQPPDDPAKASADGRYVMRPEDPKTVLVVSDPLEQASTRSAQWVERRPIVAEGVQTLSAELADGERWKITRPNADAEWMLEGEVPAGMQVAVTKGNAASYSLSLLDVADVARPGIPSSETGLDQSSVVTANTFDGLTYRLRIGKKVGDKHYVALAIEGTPDATRTPKDGESAEQKEKAEKAQAERLKQLEERLAREKALTAHVLLIEEIKLADVLVKRSTFLEKKEEKK